jgi:hypothetical protein
MLADNGDRRLGDFRLLPQGEASPTIADFRNGLHCLRHSLMSLRSLAHLDILEAESIHRPFVVEAEVCVVRNNRSDFVVK